MYYRNRQLSSVAAVAAFLCLALSVAVPTTQAGKAPAPPVKYQLILIPLSAGSTAGTTGKINAVGDVGGSTTGQLGGSRVNEDISTRRALERSM